MRSSGRDTPEPATGPPLLDLVRLELEALDRLDRDLAREILTRLDEMGANTSAGELTVQQAGDVAVAVLDAAVSIGQAEPTPDRGQAVELVEELGDIRAELAARRQRPGSVDAMTSRQLMGVLLGRIPRGRDRRGRPGADR